MLKHLGSLAIASSLLAAGEVALAFHNRRFDSDCICVAECLKTVPQSNGQIAGQFRFIKCLKGPARAAIYLKVRFLPNDKRSPPEMPTVGSKWILFIPKAIPDKDGFLLTHPGPDGAVEWNDTTEGVFSEVIQKPI